MKHLKAKIAAQRAYVNNLKKQAEDIPKHVERAEKELQKFEQQLATLDKPNRVVMFVDSDEEDAIKLWLRGGEIRRCARLDLTLDQALVYRVATATGIPFLYARDVIRELFGVEVPQ